tara:strand:+ start:4793 stop:5644 length:852 start_codon:yes stop_codon:yes gene_type:complete
MTNIKDMIQAMDQIENNAKTPAIINEASVTVSANAESAAEVGELMRVLTLGGAIHNDGSAEEIPHPHAHSEPEQGPTLRGGDIDTDMMKRQLMSMDAGEEEATEEYANEPDETHHSLSDLLASGDDIHKKKKSYAPTNGADNPMSEEEVSVKETLLAALAQMDETQSPAQKAAFQAMLDKKKGAKPADTDDADKKPDDKDKEVDEAAKPHFADIDGDGDKKEPMKKAAKDKKAAKEDVKEELWNDLIEAMGGVIEGRGKVMAGRGRGKDKKLMAGRGRGKKKK